MSDMPKEMVEIDITMANAVCDMEDIRFARGLGPGNPRRSIAWEKLVAAAERVACRVTRAKRSRPGRYKPRLEHVAWLHVLDNTEGLETNEPIRELTLSPQHPFGISGKDFSGEFPVTSVPLYAEVEPEHAN